MLRPSVKKETVKVNEFNASEYVQMHLRSPIQTESENEKRRHSVSICVRKSVRQRTYKMQRDKMKFSNLNADGTVFFK